MKGKFLVYLACLCAMLFWSLSFIWYEEAYLYFTPFTTIFLRLVLSSVLLFVLTTSLRVLQPVKKTDYKNFILLAFFEPLLYFVGESLGMQWVSATAAAVIISIVPLIVPVLAFFILKERLLVKNIIGIVISCFGVILVIVNRNFEFTVSVKGVACLGLSVIAASFYSVLLKKLADVYNAFTIVAWQNIIGVVMFLPLFLVIEPNGIRASNLSLEAFYPIIKFAVFASSGAFVFYAFSVKHLGAVKANIFTNLIPIITAVLSYFLLGKKLFLHNMAGIAIVIFGLVLSQLNHAKLYKSAVKFTKREKKTN